MANQVPNAIHRKTLVIEFAAAPTPARGRERWTHPEHAAFRSHRHTVISPYKASPRFVKESRPESFLGSANACHPVVHLLTLGLRSRPCKDGLLPCVEIG